MTGTLTRPDTDLGTARVVMVDPEMAKAWLARNRSNRQLREKVVRHLADQMLRGEFDYNGETVKLTADDDLIDGQHRLSAIVESGVAVPLLVVSGLPPEAQETVDIGSKRTAGDVFKMRGMAYHSVQAAIINLTLRVERNVARGSYGITDRDIIRYREDHPEVETSAAFATCLQSGRGWRVIPPAMLGYTHMVFRRIDEADAEDFWIAAADMVPAFRGDPALALSRRLTDNRAKKVTLPEPVVIDMVNRAWNKRRRVEPLLKLPVREIKSFAEMVQPK